MAYFQRNNSWNRDGEDLKDPPQMPPLDRRGERGVARRRRPSDGVVAYSIRMWLVVRARAVSSASRSVGVFEKRELRFDLAFHHSCLSAILFSEGYIRSVFYLETIAELSSRCHQLQHCQSAGLRTTSVVRFIRRIDIRRINGLSAMLNHRQRIQDVAKVVDVDPWDTTF
jgi:hypothetical protein